MSSYIIQNEKVLVEVDEHASEIHSFKDLETGIEYMWNGNPAYWSGRNPTLFPMVGSTYDKLLHIKGKTYATGNHGFARHSDFTCVKHDDHEIVMELKDSEETLKQYPYHFTMDIHYVLQDRTLTITYDITNENEEGMPFHFGLHPAFNVPMDQTKKYEDYQLVFDTPQNFLWKKTVMKDETVLKLNPDVPDVGSNSFRYYNAQSGCAGRYDYYPSSAWYKGIFNGWHPWGNSGLQRI